MSDCLLATIGRESLGLLPLELGGEPYLFDGSDGGANALVWAGRSWQRQTVDSPWVHGDAMVAARRGPESLRLRLWAVGETLADVRGLVAELDAALGQWSWLLTVTSPAGYSWRMWPADFAVMFDRAHVLDGVASQTWAHAARVDVDATGQPMVLAA